MMDHAATIRRMFEAINAHDVDAFGAHIADDLVEHEEIPGIPSTKEGVLTMFRMYFEAFPDLEVKVEDVIASGDKIVNRVTYSGTNEGQFMGMPATGKRVDGIESIDITVFGDDGLAHEHWGVFDAMGMMQQLGVIPVGASA
jgi:steroid delta-isomerase-like uncharacterized protein